MAIYLCRWPNGEFSIVNAKTKGDAIEMLDEWGNAEQALLSRMTDCMFDFRLGDDGQFELANIGESTHDGIMKTCFPDLNKTLATAEWDEAGLETSEDRPNEILGGGAVERARRRDSGCVQFA